MRTFLLITLLAVAIPADITSQTVIDAGKQFVLGGSQRGAFRVAAHSVGPVPVSVVERAPNGTLTERGRLEPGGRATLDWLAHHQGAAQGLAHQGLLIAARGQNYC